MIRPPTRRLTVGLLALAFAGSAAADARSDLHAAFLKNMAATSYRASITDLATGKPVSSVEFQAPDRYRISMVGGPSTIIANGTMSMQVNGRAMTVPLPKGMLEHYRSDAAWRQLENDATISDAGLGVVGAEPARKYHWVAKGKNASAGDAWVSVASGRVIQVESSGTTGAKSGAVRVSYSDFNSPAIRISLPK